MEEDFKFFKADELASNLRLLFFTSVLGYVALMIGLCLSNTAGSDKYILIGIATFTGVTIFMLFITLGEAYSNPDFVYKYFNMRLVEEKGLKTWFLDVFNEQHKAVIEANDKLVKSNKDLLALNQKLNEENKELLDYIKKKEL